MALMKYKQFLKKINENDASEETNICKSYELPCLGMKVDVCDGNILKCDGKVCDVMNLFDSVMDCKYGMEDYNNLLQIFSDLDLEMPSIKEHMNHVSDEAEQDFTDVEEDEFMEDEVGDDMEEIDFTEYTDDDDEDLEDDEIIDISADDDILVDEEPKIKEEEDAFKHWESKRILEKKYTKIEREELADNGEAMKDGSFPIKTTTDLKNAIKCYGLGKNPAAAKRHIKKRAKALGKEALLPESW